MPSSISNSNDRLPSGPGGRQWLLSILLATGFLTGLELHLRRLGHVPVVRDSMVRWADQRQRLEVDDSSGMIAVIGASRAQMGFSPAAAEAELEGYRVVHLAIEGSLCAPVLRDLAENSSFKGIVIASIFSGLFDEPTFCAGKQQSYVQYYHEAYGNLSRIEKRANLLMGTWLQQRLVTAGLPLRSLAANRLSPPPSYFRMTPDRHIQADYIGRMTEQQRADHRQERLRRVRYEQLKAASKLTDSELLAKREAWIPQWQQAIQWAKKIEHRGGKVVFVRYPTSDEHWELDQWAHPKALFWDFAAQTEATEMVHFRDVPSLADFSCPDTSHLNYDDAERFTRALIGELGRRGLFAVIK